MHIITRRRLLEFCEQHPKATVPLDTWYRMVKAKSYRSFMEIRQDFPAADYVKGKTVFDIGGNKYRLVSAIHYNTQKIYIRHVLTHEEYDQGDWQ